MLAITNELVDPRAESKPVLGPVAFWGRRRRASASAWRRTWASSSTDERTEELTADEETDLILYSSATEMLNRGLSETSEDRHMRPGTVTAELNRNVILHGTGRGYDTRGHAVRAVLLVAAAARVAGPLLRPGAP